MILHIADDEKFIDYAIDQFEEIYPSNNIFLIVVPRKIDKPQFIKKSDKVTLVVLGSKEYKKWTKDLVTYELVIFHNLILPYKNDIVLQASKSATLALFLWGREMYDKLYHFHDKLLQPETQKLVNSLNLPLVLKLKRAGRRILDYLQKEIFSITKKNERALERLDYIGAFAKEDFDLLKSILPLRARWFYYNYYSLELIAKNTPVQQVLGNNIMIGNSSSATNNHLEAFNNLLKIDLDVRNVIVPMSYGDPYYRDEVLKEGKQILGENFLPLIDFLSLEEYNKFLHSCGYIIMNHNRQQALGNIIAGLRFGAKVFLNEQNTLYSYFTRKGFVIFSISKDLNQSELNTPLDQEHIDMNRALAIKEFSRESNIKNLATSIRPIVSG